LSRVLVGYTFTSRGSAYKNLKESLKPIIHNSTLDIEEKLGETYNKFTPYIGEYFMTFIKDKNGNYFTEIENAAAYQLLAYSNCAINPPLSLNVNTFDSEVSKKLWNIDLGIFK